ncbi:MAG: HRDC domain-containing protein [Planctomycetia bacterium]|nr:HRDC domain-containing protein [Planctomycetia bacterium]
MSADVITTQSELDAFAGRLRKADRIAFDTEFVSEHTYKPELCLVQAASADEALCVDPLADIDLTPLWEVLTSPNHMVIVHAARQELLFALDATGGKRLGNLFDVQLAAGMIGMEYPAGYGNLISRLLAVVPQKGETRSDWRKRPLTDRQIEYAVADVRHLLPLHDKLKGKLAKLNRAAWFDVEMEAFQVDLENSLTRDRWRRVAGSSGMSSRSQAVLRELWMWREREAERRNLPARLVLRDDLLVEMSKRKVSDPKHLGAIRGMERPELRRAVPEFSQLIEKALRLPDEACPPMVRTDTNPQLSMLGQFLSSALTSICRAAEISPSLVGTANDVRELVNYRLNGVADSEGEIPILARGWRAEVVGHLIEELLAGRMSIRIADPNSEHPLVFEPQK